MEKTYLDLRFADDVALTTEDVRDMNHVLNTLNEENLKIGFRINEGENDDKILLTHIDNIQIDGADIEKQLSRGTILPRSAA